MKVLSNITRYYYPIGAKIRYERIILQVAPQKDNAPSCVGCYFEKWTQQKRGQSISCFKHGMSCTASVRKDKRHVIFKETTKYEKKV